MPKSKKISISKKVLIAFITCIFVILEIATLTEQKVSKANTTIITGHFEKIEKVVYRGDVSYDLYIDEDNNPYKIAADYINCFDYNNFSKEAYPGEIITLCNSKIDFLRSTFITDIYINKSHYFNTNCIDNLTQGNKPIHVVVVFLIYGFVIALIILKGATLK